MRQFEVMRFKTGTWLLVVDTTRHDFWWGFRRPVRQLQSANPQA